MKKLLLIPVFLFTLAVIPSVVFAQGMPAAVSSDGHTAREEAEGKEIWEKLQGKQVTCDKLLDNDFGALGEYFMGQMLAPSGTEGVGNSHEAMNTMMEKMMGKDGEEQMHVVMGKRLSGCNTSGWGNMMGWGGFRFFGFLIWLFWIVLLVDLILLGVWFWKKIKKEK